jgi:NCAIR mutase (PurE)-related protein
LTQENLSSQEIDRIYKALFVYTTGFYELVNQNIHSHRVIVTANILKVFIILLEYTCKTGYKTIITALGEEHKKDLEKVQEELVKEKEDLVCKLTDNSKALEELKDELIANQKVALREKDLRMRIEQEIIGRRQLIF